MLGIETLLLVFGLIIVIAVAVAAAKSKATAQSRVCPEVEDQGRENRAR